MKHAAPQRLGMSSSRRGDNVVFNRPGRNCSRRQRCGDAYSPARLSRQPLGPRQDHQIYHRRADQELFFSSAYAPQVKPPHAMLALGVSEEPFDPALQPHRPFVKPGFHLGSSKIANVLIVQSDQGTTPRRRAFLSKHARFAVTRIGSITVYAGRQVKCVVPEEPTGRTDKGVGVTIIAEAHIPQVNR